jgi:hypothetical protein
MEYVPTAHGKQLADPNGANSPPAHETQIASRGTEPGSQDVHEVKSDVDTLPESQSVQVLVAPREYLPVEQSAHELLELSAKVPAPQ